MLLESHATKPRSLQRPVALRLSLQTSLGMNGRSNLVAYSGSSQRGITTTISTVPHRVTKLVACGMEPVVVETAGPVNQPTALPR